MIGFSELQVVQQRDEMKKIICDMHGITLLVIPYWWNKTIESVAQTIHFARPDILLSSKLLTGEPIPCSFPMQQHHDQDPYIPKDIVNLATLWLDVINLTG